MTTSTTWVSLFTEDGSFDVYGRSFDGHEGLRKMMAAAPKGLHLGGPPLIRMHDADTAETEQNLLFIDRQSGESRSARLPGWRGADRRGMEDQEEDAVGSSCRMG